MPLDSAVALVDALRLGHLLEPHQLAELTRDLAARSLEPRALAGELIRRGWLTPFQANHLLQGRGGELLLGSYVLLERLGEGGMGAVYKARNWKLGRVVALKVIRKERLASEDAVRRFHREIRAAAALSHPNIVAAHDADEVHGTHFFAMECVEGSDLAKLIKQHGPLPLAQACDWVRQAAVGLQHAHERGMVHRDIKPHNLLLTKQGVVKILDMGLARVTVGEDGEASTTMTQEGMVMGTPDYMAPEQAEESHTVDIRADIYSLGCTLYQLLTGKVPFPGGSLIQKLKKHQSEQPAPVEQRRPDVPPTVCEVVYKLMAKRPEDRYQTPVEAAAALASCTIQRAPSALPVTSGSPTLAAVATAQAVPAATGETVNRVFDFQATDEATEVVQAARRRSEKRRLLLAIVGGGVLLVAMAAAFVALYPRRGRQLGDTPPSSAEGAEKHWRPGSVKDVLPGLIARPARLPGLKRWQIETNVSRSDINSVAWSPDGKYIAYGDYGRGVRILDAVSRRLVRILFGHEDTVSAVAWSLDSKWLASASWDKTVRLWQADGTPGPVLKGHTAAVMCAAWSPDGKRLASGGYWGDGTVRLWSADGTPGPVLKHETLVVSVAWSPDGNTLASSDSEARLIRLWNTADGTQLAALGPLPKHPGPLAWSPDGRHLASGGGDSEKDKVIGWIWDAAERKQKVPLQYHVHWLNWLGWSSEGKLASVTQDGYLFLLDPENGKVLSRTAQEGSAYASASWSPDGRQIADSAGRIVQVAKDGRLTPAWGTPRVMHIKVAWSPDGKRLAAASADKTVRLWRADGRAGPVLEGHTHNVVSVAWSPDSKRLASASYDFTARLWKADGSAGAVVRHEESVNGVAWSPDGKWWASASLDKIRLWREDGTPGPILRGHTAGLTCVAWSPDGKHLASTANDQTVRLWGVDGSPGPVLKGHEGGVRSVAWSPDGKRIASVGDDKTVRLWRADGTPGLILKGHELRVESIAWSPDGEQLASGSFDGTVRLWGADGTAGAVLNGHNGGVYSVAWSPDGKRLASAGRDSAIQVSSAKGEPEWTIVVLPDGRSATVSTAGELLHGDADVVEQELVYLVEQSDGRVEVLRPFAFRKRVQAAETATGR